MCGAWLERPNRNPAVRLTLLTRTLRTSMADPDIPSRPPVLLVVQNEEWTARSFDSILGPNGYAVLHAYTGRQALDLAAETRPDAIILDAKLPDRGGVEVCRALRDDPRVDAAMPIVLTTSEPIGRTLMAEAHAAGAWEFYAQPLDSELFLLKLANLLRAKREVDRARAASLVDQTTGLYSFRGLARRAQEVGADAARRRCALACVAVSAEDGEEELAQKLAAEVAERIVAHLGQVCRKCGRASDVVGRIGRTDFGIIAPATERTGAERLVERLRASLDDSPLSVDGQQRTLGLRVGCSVVPNFAEASVDAVELLRRATLALRHARAREERTIWFDEIPLSELH